MTCSRARRGTAAAAGGSGGAGRARAARSASRRAAARRAPARRGAAAGPAAERRASRRPGWRAGLVARPERRGRVDAAGDRTASASARGGPPRRRAPSAPEVGRRRVAAAGPRSAVPGQRRVGVVDLGHPPRRRPGRRRVVTGQVGVVGPGEPPPGGLDACRVARRARRRGRHADRVSPRRSVRRGPARRRRLTGRPVVPSPMDRGTRSTRAGLAAAVAAAPLGLAYRFALVYRAARRLPAPAPADGHAGGPRPAVRDDGSSARATSTCRPGSSRPATARPVRASRWSTAGSRPATGRCPTRSSCTPPASTA